MDAAVREHMPQVRGWLDRAGLKGAEADGALHDVLAEFCLQFDQLTRSGYEAYLRAAVERARHERSVAEEARQVSLAEALEVATPDEAGLDAELDSRRAGAYLIGALNVLPRFERTLLVNARWRGKSRTQIASELGMPSGSVATGLSRADNLLQQALDRLKAQDLARAGERASRLPPWAAPGRHQPGISVVSRAEAVVPRGPWIFVNNQWARARARGRFDQCLLFRRSGYPAAGWSWSWPRQPGLPIAFPQAVYGWSPWRGEGPTDPRFPLPLRQLRRLQLDYDVHTTALGQYTLLLVMYLIAEQRSTLDVTPPAIITELTVVLDHRGDTVARAAVVDSPSIDGVRYDVRRVFAMGGPDLMGYPAFFFQPRIPKRSGRLNLLHLLTHLERRRWVDGPLALASVEFGNEVHGGAGTTWLERLELGVAA